MKLTDMIQRGLLTQVALFNNLKRNDYGNTS